MTSARSLTAHGTLYKALGRLEVLKLVVSQWEDPAAATEGRPRRRLYELTRDGTVVAERARVGKAAAPHLHLAWELA